MSITFNQIPSNLRIPGVYNEFDASLAGSFGGLKKVLILGQKLSEGTATSGSAIEVFSTADAREKFGKGSQLATLCEAFKNINSSELLYALPFSDETGSTAAVAEVKLSGIAIENSTLHLYLNGRHVFVPLSKGDDAAKLVSKLVSKINAGLNFEFEASESMGVATSAILTSKAPDTLTNIKLITSGTLSLSIDGTAIFLTGLDFSGAADETAIATILQTALQAELPGAKATFSSGKFIIKSPSTGASSSISTAKGTAGVALGLELGIRTNGTNEGTKLMLTSKNKGEVGNDLPIALNLNGEAEAKGFSIIITSPTGGATNPIIKQALLDLGDEYFSYLVCPFLDVINLKDLADELDSRYSAERQIGARAFLSKRGSFFEIKTFGESLNSPHLSVLSASNSPQSSALWATTQAAIMSRFLSEDPAKPLNEKILKGLFAPKTLFKASERNQLLFSGISTFKTSSSTEVLSERVITTYTQTSTGDSTNAYLDIQIPETLEAIRMLRNFEVKRQFDGYKLAENPGVYGAGTKVMTPSIFRTFLLDFYERILQNQKAWVEDYEHYKASLQVEINTSDKTRLDFLDQPTLIGQFYIAAGKTQFK